MAYLVHHTLNRNGIYNGGKPDPYPLMKKSLTDKSQCKKELKDCKISIPFKTKERKSDFARPIHVIINSGKIEGRYFW